MIPQTPDNLAQYRAYMRRFLVGKHKRARAKQRAADLEKNKRRKKRKAAKKARKRARK